MAVTAKHRFPSDPILTKLLRAAKSTSNKGSIIHDAYGYDKSYGQLLADILRTRDMLRERLPAEALSERGVLRQDAPYICTLAMSVYEFLVAFFAIRALGGACAPLSSGVAPEEASYFLSTTDSSCLLVGSHCIERGNHITAYVKKHDNKELVTVPIHGNAEPIPCTNVDIDPSIPLPATGPGLLVFTSGTTGLPKGAVIPRRCFAFDKTLAPGNATACNRPPTWMGGLQSMIHPVICGAELYATKERAGADVVWELFRRHRITYMVLSPGLLRMMRSHYTNHLCKLTTEERCAYLDGMKNLDKICCAGTMIAPADLRFWTELTGLPFRNIYAATETTRMMHNLDSKITNSIGHPIDGVQAKLSHGDHGEIRVKSPWMMTHYVGNEEATNAAFDQDGFYKTGDLGEVKDGEYVFCGRANVDFIYFNGYTIPTLKVETSLTNLPYITEAHVLGIPDHDVKETCASVIRLAPTSSNTASPADKISLAKLRLDLAESLPAFMLPSHLRILEDGEDVPRTEAMKPVKREMLNKFFVRGRFWDAEDSVPGVESVGDLGPQQEGARPWDWVGLQRAA